MRRSLATVRLVTLFGALGGGIVAACGAEVTLVDPVSTGAGGAGGAGQGGAGQGGAGQGGAGQGGAGQGGAGVTTTVGAGGSGGAGGGVTTTTGVGGGGGAGGGNVCEQGDCQACIECASSDGCSAAGEACVEDEACLAINDCIANGCALDDQPCWDACIAAHPGGAADFIALGDCFLCAQCPSDGAAEYQWDCDGPSACELESADCQSCIVCSIEGWCEEQLEAYEQSPPAQNLDQCIFNVCGSWADAACVAACEAEHPAGVAIYEALTDCIFCAECPGDCVEYVYPCP